MAKFKCKQCGQKFKVSSHKNAYREIQCNVIKCPVFNLDKSEKKIVQGVETILDFSEYDVGKFNIIEKYQTLPPEEEKHDFGGWM